MLERLNQVAEHYEQLEARLSVPGLSAAEMAALMKEYSSLTPLYEKICDYKAALEDADEARQMLDGEKDAEMKSFLQQTHAAAVDKANALRDEIQILLLP